MIKKLLFAAVALHALSIGAARKAKNGLVLISRDGSNGAQLKWINPEDHSLVTSHTFPASDKDFVVNHTETSLRFYEADPLQGSIDVISLTGNADSLRYVRKPIHGEQPSPRGLSFATSTGTLFWVEGGGKKGPIKLSFSTVLRDNGSYGEKFGKVMSVELPSMCSTLSRTALLELDTTLAIYVPCDDDVHVGVLDKKAIKAVDEEKDTKKSRVVAEFDPTGLGITGVTALTGLPRENELYWATYKHNACEIMTAKINKATGVIDSTTARKVLDCAGSDAIKSVIIRGMVVFEQGEVSEYREFFFSTFKHFCDSPLCVGIHLLPAEWNEQTVALPDVRTVVRRGLPELPAYETFSPGELRRMYNADFGGNFVYWTNMQDGHIFHLNAEQFLRRNRIALSLDHASGHSAPGQMVVKKRSGGDGFRVLITDWGASRILQFNVTDLSKGFSAEPSVLASTHSPPLGIAYDPESNQIIWSEPYLHRLTEWSLSDGLTTQHYAHRHDESDTCRSFFTDVAFSKDLQTVYSLDVACQQVVKWTRGHTHGRVMWPRRPGDKVHTSLGRKFAPRAMALDSDTGIVYLALREKPIILAAFDNAYFKIESLLTSPQRNSLPARLRGLAHHDLHSEEEKAPVSASNHPAGHAITTHPAGHAITTHPAGHASATHPVGHASTTHPAGHASTTHITTRSTETDGSLQNIRNVSSFTTKVADQLSVTTDSVSSQHTMIVSNDATIGSRVAEYVEHFAQEEAAKKELREGQRELNSLVYYATTNQHNTSITSIWIESGFLMWIEAVQTDDSATSEVRQKMLMESPTHQVAINAAAMTLESGDHNAGVVYAGRSVSIDPLGFPDASDPSHLGGLTSLWWKVLSGVFLGISALVLAIILYNIFFNYNHMTKSVNEERTSLKSDEEAAAVGPPVYSPTRR